MPVGRTISGSSKSPSTPARTSRPSLGVGQAEGVRNGAALERVADLVRAAGPRLTDDMDGVRGDLQRVRPLEQEAGHGLVEHLVRTPGRPQHVVVDPPVRHRVVDGLAGGPVAPSAPLDQETALGVRMELVRPVRAARCRSSPTATGRRARARPAHRRPAAPRASEAPRRMTARRESCSRASSAPVAPTRPRSGRRGRRQQQGARDQSCLPDFSGLLVDHQIGLRPQAQHLARAHQVQILVVEELEAVVAAPQVAA